MVGPRIPPLLPCALLLLAGAACGPSLNQTTITCPAARTLLDGVCVNEAVADYVACVRAQGAQLGSAKSVQVSAEAGTLAVKAGGAAELKENLEKKYAVSDAATLEIIRACSGVGKGPAQPAPAVAPAAAAAAAWATCASEGGVCDVPGAHVVRYGVEGRHAYKTTTGRIGCDNPTFGDPAEGLVKSCATGPVPPQGWTRCADENGTCAFAGAAAVAYGAGASFVYKTVAGSVACNNQTFGDPAAGLVKACYYR
jgi:hypothetical protein